MIFCISFLFTNVCAEPKNTEIKNLISKGALIIDVRSKTEFDEGHYNGAKLIPYNEILSRISELGDKNKPIILYCRSGRRSGIAKDTLIKAGFTNVINAGGLQDMP
jgi:phage shock protein E